MGTYYKWLLLTDSTVFGRYYSGNVFIGQLTNAAGARETSSNKSPVSYTTTDCGTMDV